MFPRFLFGQLQNNLITFSYYPLNISFRTEAQSNFFHLYYLCKSFKLYFYSCHNFDPDWLYHCAKKIFNDCIKTWTSLQRRDAYTYLSAPLQPVYLFSMSLFKKISSHQTVFYLKDCIVKVFFLLIKSGMQDKKNVDTSTIEHKLALIMFCNKHRFIMFANYSIS